ncbi:MAG: Aha1 domain superfamily [Candidatus Saccharibacteria bacterium]|nr:Aha1 domain superfamily [Candidatus Saccharibacteria bacterium]
MQDTIVREITVKAAKERVYKAITDPEQIIAWFPDAIEGTLEAGQRPIFTFTKENHKTQIYVEAANPFEYFAYRWVPGGTGIIGDVLTVPNTLVEFHIEELGEETKITLKESGFSSLPSEVAEKSFNQNSGGWGYMMGRLEKALNQA